jgi:hypothetical protein
MTWGELFRTIGMAIVIAVVGSFAFWIVANELRRFYGDRASSWATVPAFHSPTSRGVRIPRSLSAATARRLVTPAAGPLSGVKPSRRPLGGLGWFCGNQTALPKPAVVAPYFGRRKRLNWKRCLVPHGVWWSCSLFSISANSLPSISRSEAAS